MATGAVNVTDQAVDHSQSDAAAMAYGAVNGDWTHGGLKLSLGDMGDLLDSPKSLMVVAALGLLVVWFIKRKKG